MKQYDDLTKYIDLFEKEPLETTFTHADVDEGFLQAEYYKYSPLVDAFMQDVLKAVDEHPELDLYHYTEIIDSYETESGYVRQAEAAISEEYLERLDIKGVLAWIVSCVRAEKFRQGTLYGSIDKGYIGAWLSRLSELDA